MLRRLIAALVVAGVFVLWAVPARAAAPPATMRWHTFTTENGLAGNSVQALWEDPQGHIWLGTENGISRYDGTTWTTYRTSDGLIGNTVWSISGDTRSVWVATTNGLSLLRQGRWHSYTTNNGLPSNDVRAVLVARDGTVWAGTFGLGIVRMRPDTEEWERVTFPLRFQGLGLVVQDIWEDPDGAIWFGTNAFGALRLDGDAFEQFTFRAGQRNTVWSVGAEQRSSSTWLGTFQGIVQAFPNDTVDVPYQLVAGVPLSTTEVLAVAGGISDDLWFGTRAQGVVHRSAGAWRHYSTRDGLSQDYVQTILVDRQQRVWFGTRGGGATLLAREPLQAATLIPQVSAREVRSGMLLAQQGVVLDSDQNNLQFQFDLTMGWLPPQDVQFRYWLQSAAPTDRLAVPRVQTVRSQPGAAIRAASEVFIGLAPGSYTLYSVAAVGDVASPPAAYAFTIRSAPPTLSAETLEVRSEGQQIEQGLTLPSTLFGSRRQMQLQLNASDDVTPPDALRYRYRVRSLMPEWRMSDSPTIDLVLPQGQHVIEAQVLDHDNNQSETLRFIAIVPTPLWQTILLYLLLILLPAVGGSIVGAAGYRRWSRQQALRRAVRGYIIPYDVGPLITVPDRYIGRRHVLDTVLGKLNANNFYIYGEKRIGKTSLLLQLKQRLIQRNHMQDERFYIPVFRNMQDLPPDRFWLYLVRSIAAEVPDLPVYLAALNEQTTSYDDLDAESDLERLRLAFEQHGAPPDTPPRALCIVLLLDEVDTLQRYDPAIRQRFRAFCQHMQHQVRVVLAGVLPPRGEASDTSPWYNIFEPIGLGPLATSDIVHLIRNYNHNPYSYEPAAEHAIVQASDGKPFATQWLCSEAVKAMLAEQRSRVLLPDVEQAVQTLVRERSGDYAALWQQLRAETRHALTQAQQHGGQVGEGLPRDDLERLLDAGVLYAADQGYRLAALVARWLAAQGTEDATR